MVTGLEAKDVFFGYPGGIQALAGADVRLEPGELLAVIGPNGSGKTTLLRCLAGQLKPDSGTVLAGDRALDGVGLRERARMIAVVPQFLQSVQPIRARDFVLGGRYSHLRAFRGATSADMAVVDRALEEADALELGDRLLDEISGGQRQRVLIARALAQEAPVLLVDEPTTGLDPDHQIRVFELLARLTCLGSSVFVVTHELALACQFATRVVLMNEGKVHASGTVEEVMQPQVLQPVYGKHLRFGAFEGPDGRTRPFVLPWLSHR